MMKKIKFIRVLFVLNLLCLLYYVRLSKHENKSLNTLKISKEDNELNTATQPLNQNKMESAVEWLQEGLELIMTHDEQMQSIGLFEQAKEMEKQRNKKLKLAIDCLADFVNAIDSEKVILAEEYENAKIFIKELKQQ